MRYADMLLAGLKANESSPGFAKLFGELSKRYRANALADAPPEIAEDLGGETTVFCLHVSSDKRDEASKLTLELCIDIEDDCNERYMVLVLTAD